MERRIISNWPMSSWENYRNANPILCRTPAEHTGIAIPGLEENEQPASGPSFFHTTANGKVQPKTDDAFFQTKLAVGQPGDEYEQEADAVAGSVVGSSGADVKKKKINGIQRLSSSKEEEQAGTNDERMKQDKDIQRQPLAGNEKSEGVAGGTGNRTGAADNGIGNRTGNRTRSEVGNGTASSHVSNRVEQSAGTGRSMSGKLLADMSHQFGMDLSDVTIHTDKEATQLNKELGALAFTHGKDIYFNAGKFNPETSEGKFLLAHELTHVVQQSGEDQQIQRMAACPAHLNATDPVPPGWKPYYGNSSVFHCGFRGILEDRSPTPDDPMNECFYDHAGVLVDAKSCLCRLWWHTGLL